MAQALTYPGVYIEEDDSGPRAITGIQPSITAFVGRTRTGPLGEPVTVHNYREFVATFGGSWPEGGTWLPESVEDFFRHGGSTAVIVRAVSTITLPAWASVKLEGLTFTARYPGSDGNGIAVRLTPIDVTWRAKAPEKKAPENKDAPGKTPPTTFEAEFDAGRVRIDIGRTSSGNFSVLESFTATPGEISDTLSAQSTLVEAHGDPTFKSIPLKVVDENGTADEKKATKEANETTKKGHLDTIRNTEELLRGGEDGAVLSKDSYTEDDDDPKKNGALNNLDFADLFSLLVVPPPRDLPESAKADDRNDLTKLRTDWPTVLQEAASIAKKRRAFLIVDGHSDWNEPKKRVDEIQNDGFVPADGHAAVYTPWYKRTGPSGQTIDVPPSGAIAGIYASTEVWRAPAGLGALIGAPAGPSRAFTQAQNGDLNVRAINCLMPKTARPLTVWGTRTTAGYDGSGSLWRYVPVRRLFNYVEETLYRNTEWVVFQPNDETLWMQVKTSIEGFLHGLFIKGAFQGERPTQAYYVECGWGTMTQADIDNGIINIVVGIAPVKPAEFVVLTFRHFQQTR